MLELLSEDIVELQTFLMCLTDISEEKVFGLFT